MKGDNLYPYWPSFRSSQRPDNIVGSAISGMLGDLGFNEIPRGRNTDVPVKTVPRPGSFKQGQADSFGNDANKRGQVESGLFAMIMTPMNKPAIVKQTDPKNAQQESSDG